MDSTSALQEFLRPPPALRQLKRETEILAMANHAELTLRPGTENREEQIIYYRWGSGSKRVLLVHGWGGRAAQFFALIPRLVDAGFEVIAFDAPLLIFHDPEDRDLPFSHSEAIAAAWPGAELIASSRAGHWRIMRDRAV